MALLAIEVHDAGILAKGEGDRSPRCDSPGYAAVDGAELLTGDAARSSARLRPRHVDSRFWCELDTTPLSAPFDGSAQLACDTSCQARVLKERLGSFQFRKIV